MKQSRIWLITDDPEFVNSLLQSWQRWSCEPAYTVIGALASGEVPEDAVAVVDGAGALAQLAGGIRLAIAITGEEALPEAGVAAQRVVQLRRSLGWADVAAALAEEAALCVEAQNRLAEAERQMRASERFAAMGRFIAESRHGLGNALTSVLGNSELVLLETETGLREEVRGQLETIHEMSLKIYETLQRLTSLDMEMQVAERQAARETLRKPTRGATVNEFEVHRAEEGSNR